MPLSRAERERGVSIARVNFGVQKGNVVMQWTPQACVSLHALARRIERGSTRDHSALALDLAKLVQTDEKSERVDTLAGRSVPGDERIRWQWLSAERCQDVVGQLNDCPVSASLWDSQGRHGAEFCRFAEAAGYGLAHLKWDRHQRVKLPIDRIALNDRSSNPNAPF
jgi:hypothetical protein